MIRDRLFKFAPAAIPVLVTLGFYWPVLSGRFAFFWDSYSYSYPLALYLRDSLGAGIWPFWNPFVLSGEAMFAQPAVSAYHPLHLLIAFAPSWIDSFIILQIGLVSLAVVGTLGCHRLFRHFGYSAWAASFGASVYGLTFFGPLLGQLSVAFAVAIFPWLSVSVSNLVSRNRFDWIQVSRTAIVGALYFWGSYFGMVMYATCFLIGQLIYQLAKSRREIRWSQFANVAVAAALFTNLVLPHLLPAFENRNVYYSNVSKNFVSPDPRLRGTVLPIDHVVEVIPNERTLIGILLNSRDLASDGAFWVIGPGLAVLALFLSSAYLLRRDARVRFLWGSIVIGILYLLGPKSIVFDLVFEHVPLLNNIRYPVFSYPFVIFLVLALAVHAFDFYSRKLSVRNRVIVASLLSLEVLIFAGASGLFDGRAPTILREISSSEREKVSLRDRKRDVVLESMERIVSDESLIAFENLKWLSDKTPINHGYSTSDSPLYWYLKASGFLRHLAYCPTSVSRTDLPKVLDNDTMKSVASTMAGIGFESAFVSESMGIVGPCTISALTMRPNSFTLSISTPEDALLVLTDKNYPGWTVKVDGKPSSIITTNALFKGVNVSPGSHSIDFEFRPQSFIVGLYFSFAALVAIVLGCFITTSRKHRSVQSFDRNR